MNPKNKYAHMGDIVTAKQVIISGLDQKSAKRIVWLLAACMAVMLTGFGIIFPIFARRLGEFGSGVEALGMMTISFALANIIASPIMGSLADKYGRRPLVIGSLVAYLIVNIGFLLATSTEWYIAIRALDGISVAALTPAAMGIVADIAPEDKRARWVGIVSGGFSIGWILGPTLGGFLYDSMGFEAPFIISAISALITLIIAYIMIPETRTKEIIRRDTLRSRRVAKLASTEKESFWDTLPRPLGSFSVLLIILFILYFAWTFFEPQLMFYVYDDLGWTSAQFGLTAGAYGIFLTFGEFFLGHMSDRFGRKPIIFLGVFLNSFQYLGMMITSSFRWLLLSNGISGLGESFASPAINAYLMDITKKQHRSRVMGIAGAAGSLGSIIGPGLAIIFAKQITPLNTFAFAFVSVILGALLVLFILGEPSKLSEEIDLSREFIEKRRLAAQASLRGVVKSAAASRNINEINRGLLGKHK